MTSHSASPVKPMTLKSPQSKCFHFSCFICLAPCMHAVSCLQGFCGSLYSTQDSCLSLLKTGTGTTGWCIPVIFSFSPKQRLVHFQKQFLLIRYSRVFLNLKKTFPFNSKHSIFARYLCRNNSISSNNPVDKALSTSYRGNYETEDCTVIRPAEVPVKCRQKHKIYFMPLKTSAAFISL